MRLCAGSPGGVSRFSLGGYLGRNEGRDMMDLAWALDRVRQTAPLVQCITNFVTVNDCANIILAAGGNASMAGDSRESAEAVHAAQALVCNLGAIAQVESMVLAGQEANALDIPVVLDPVAAGGTRLRREGAARLLEEVRFAAIRGNGSEIRYLAGREGASGSGVDVAAGDELTGDNLAATAALVRAFARQTGAVVAMSGAVDMVTDGERVVLVRNGCATMTRITGSGCMVTSLMGAFCGAMPDAPLTAAVAALAAMGLAGEIAEEKRLAGGTGNATFRTDLIDAVFNMTGKTLTEGARYEIYKG